MLSNDEPCDLLQLNFLPFTAFLWSLLLFSLAWLCIIDSSSHSTKKEKCYSVHRCKVTHHSFFLDTLSWASILWVRSVRLLGLLYSSHPGHSLHYPHASYLDLSPRLGPLSTGPHVFLSSSLGLCLCSHFAGAHPSVTSWKGTREIIFF